MSKIAVDIDNTLYSFEYAAREVYIELAHERGDKSLFKGAYNPWQEWRSMTDTCGDDICGEVITRVHSPEVISRQRPYPQCRVVLQELADDGHELLYISNRDPDTHDATAEWLEDYGFPTGKLACTFEDKIPLTRDCEYIIDDRPKTLVQFAYDDGWEGGRLGFGMAFPFNQALTDVPRIYLAPTWTGIRYYLIDKGVLSVAEHISLG